MWHFSEYEFYYKELYIFREMQVALVMVWNSEQQSYLTRADERKTVQCSPRMAVEDVSHASEIVEYFGWG